MPTNGWLLDSAAGTHDDFLAPWRLDSRRPSCVATSRQVYNSPIIPCYCLFFNGRNGNPIAHTDTSASSIPRCATTIYIAASLLPWCSSAHHAATIQPNGAKNEHTNPTHRMSGLTFMRNRYVSANTPAVATITAATTPPRPPPMACSTMNSTNTSNLNSIYVVTAVTIAA